jgi:hypothetical protein
MIHPPPITATQGIAPPQPAITITVNTVYFDASSQNAIVNLRGIKGTAYLNWCDGRALHVRLVKVPGQEYGTVFLQCKGEKASKAFFLK